jgi:hypothetical protein
VDRETGSSRYFLVGPSRSRKLKGAPNCGHKVWVNLDQLLRVPPESECRLAPAITALLALLRKSGSDITRKLPAVDLGRLRLINEPFPIGTVGRKHIVIAEVDHHSESLKHLAIVKDQPEITDESAGVPDQEDVVLTSLGRAEHRPELLG